MEKLVEREPAARRPFVAAPALAIQFFLIPLAVVGVTVLVYAGFRSLVADDRTAEDYLLEVHAGGTNRRWPAAYELSRLMADPTVRADPALGPALVKAFDAAKEDDPRVRRYLALALGRLEPPLPAEALPHLVAALDDPDAETRISVMWALGSSGDPTAVPHLQRMYASGDAGVRKMAVYALGALPGDEQLPTLQNALQDDAVDVRWNAAIGLARHGRQDGAVVVRQMLDRAHVEQVVTREVREYADQDPVADVMISGIRAAAALDDPALRSQLTELSQNDRSLKVRQAALDALKGRDE